jgi:hypothetical protein
LSDSGAQATRPGPDRRRSRARTTIKAARWRAPVALFDAGRCPVAEIAFRACMGAPQRR